MIEGSTESEPFVFFNPDCPKAHRDYDLGPDLELQSKSVEVESHRILTEDYLRIVRTLNMKQKEFFIHVLHWIKTKEEPLHLFLTGGAGVGKSLYQAMTRHLCSESGEDPEDCRVLICAPTGTAAYNVDGYTVHGTFKLLCHHLKQFEDKIRKLVSCHDRWSIHDQ